MKTLIDPRLGTRPFGTSLLSVSQLRHWMAAHSYEFPIVQLYGKDFVQVEYLLCLIESSTLSEVTFGDAMAFEKIAQPGSSADDPTAQIEELAHWRRGAKAHLDWRRLIEVAVASRELTLLNDVSKLPMSLNDSDRVANEASAAQVWQPGAFSDHVAQTEVASPEHITLPAEEPSIVDWPLRKPKRNLDSLLGAVYHVLLAFKEAGLRKPLALDVLSEFEHIFKATGRGQVRDALVIDRVRTIIVHADANGCSYTITNGEQSSADLRSIGDRIRELTTRSR